MQELCGGPTGPCLPAPLTGLSSSLAAPLARGGKWGDVRQLVPVAEWKVGQRDFIFQFVSVLLCDLMNVHFWAEPNSQCKFVPQGTEAQMRVQVYLHVNMRFKTLSFQCCFETTLLFFFFFRHYLINVATHIFYYHDLHWLIFKVNS